MEGDGHKIVFHCPNAEQESYWYHEPDASPVYCKEKVDEEKVKTEK